MIDLGSTIIAVPYQPIVADGQIDVEDIVAIQMRNAGTATVRLFKGGTYSLSAGETLSVNITEDGIATLNITNPPLLVAFDTSTGPSKRLEYFVLRRIPNNPC